MMIAANWWNKRILWVYEYYLFVNTNIIAIPFYDNNNYYINVMNVFRIVPMIHTIRYKSMIVGIDNYYNKKIIINSNEIHIFGNKNDHNI